ncbi:MAG: group 1 glycosyl transferase [Frankiales bacterium]|nr:group 1 glycosyl transferase [Frankiales bacterium]
MTRRLRIAAYHNLAPGGALRAADELLTRLARDHDVVVFTPALSLGGSAPGGDATGLVVRSSRAPLGRRIAARSGPLQPAVAVRVLDGLERRIARQIDGGGFDVAFVHPCQITATPLILERLRLPSVYLMQEPRRRSFEAGYNPYIPRRNDPAARVLRWGIERMLRRRDVRAAQAAQLILANSFYSYESIYRAYGRESVVTHMAVDMARFRVDDSGARADACDGQHVLSIGGVEAAKGHDLAIEALGLLPADRRPHLRIVYERESGPYRDVLEALALRHGVTVHFEREISDDALIVRYNTAVATLCTARLEPFGLTVLESLSCGTPVVAVREGGFRETVRDGVNGFLVPRAAQQVADALAKVLAGELGRGAAIRDSLGDYWDWSRATERVDEQLQAWVIDRPAP